MKKERNKKRASKSRVFSRKLIISLSASALFLAAVPARADSPRLFESREYGISIEIPAEFARETRVPPPGIVLLSRGGTYPTFNIVPQPGRYDGNREEDHESRLIESYRAVGITDVRVAE